MQMSQSGQNPPKRTVADNGRSTASATPLRTLVGRAEWYIARLAPVQHHGAGNNDPGEGYVARDHRRLAAIVSLDVVGYSRLMGVDDSGTLAALKAHRRELIDPKIAEHDGRIVKTTGDGLLLEFSSVVDAVRCAVDVQRGMAERNAGVAADKRLDFRIGINVGDIIIDGDDIFGDGVNVAARLEGAGRSRRHLRQPKRARSGAGQAELCLRGPRGAGSQEHRPTRRRLPCVAGCGSPGAGGSEAGTASGAIGQATLATCARAGGRRRGARVSGLAPGRRTALSCNLPSWRRIRPRTGG